MTRALLCSLELTGPLLPGALADVCAALARSLCVEEALFPCNDDEPDVAFHVFTGANKSTRHFNACGGVTDGCNVTEVLGLTTLAPLYDVLSEP